MGTRFQRFVHTFWPVFVILLLETILFFTNFIPNTHLVGWDNLYPELNFDLNIQRVFTSIWQEYRGLGHVDGISYIANIPHYLFLWLLSFIFPQNILRYLYIFITHFLGGIGAYLLISLLLKKSQIKNKAFPILGALLYQYNFATIQMFHLPFELFVTHFAALPWAIFSLINYLQHPNKSKLMVFFIVLLFSTPQAHTPTIFIVFALSLVTIMISWFISNGKKSIKTIFMSCAVIFCTNAFWGLPYIYSALQNAHIITNSKNNQMTTDNLFLQNHKFGDLQNTILLKGLSLDFVQYDKTSEVFDYVFKPWIIHFNNPFVVFFGWFLFLCSVLGIFSVIYKKEKYLYPFITLWIFGFAMLGNDIPIIKYISLFFRTYIPYFHDIFRFVFTKFSILFALMYSIFVIYGIVTIIKKIHPTKTGAVQAGLLLIPFFALLIITFPVFQGHFFYENLKVNIPKAYFDTFNFFSQKDRNTRIAILPMPSYWAWTQTNWGAIGSGFIWYGLPQALLDRAFDPWSNYNENFYWETTQALYTSDVKRLETVLEKYDVTWILLDKNIINQEKPAGLIDLKSLENNIDISNKIQFVTSFDQIKVYKIKKSNPSTQFVSLVKNASNIGPQYASNDYDPAISKNNPYITDPKTTLDEYYPFRSLFSGKMQKDLEYKIEERNEQIIFSAQIPKEIQNYTLTTPYFDPESLIELEKDQWDDRIKYYPEIYIDGQLVTSIDENSASSSAILKSLSFNKGKIEIRIPKVAGYYSYNSDFWNDFSQEKRSCNVFNTGEYKHELVEENGKKLLRLTSVNSSNCIGFDFAYLPQRQSYLVSLETKNVQGKGLFFSITNKQTTRTFLEVYLDAINGNRNIFQKSYFIIPPMESSSLGFSLDFDNISIGREKTINEIKSIAFYQIPYDFLTQLKFIKPTGFDILEQNNYKTTEFKSLTVDHPDPIQYKVTIPPQTDLSKTTLVLWQGKYDGWLAFEKTSTFPYFKRLTNHVLVNNWANGWSFNGVYPDSIGTQDKNLSNSQNLDASKTTIYLLFWPQILEFVGFGLLPVPILWVFKKPVNPSPHRGL